MQNGNKTCFYQDRKLQLKSEDKQPKTSEKLGYGPEFHSWMVSRWPRALRGKESRFLNFMPSFLLLHQMQEKVQETL